MVVIVNFIYKSCAGQAFTLADDEWYVSVPHFKPCVVCHCYSLREEGRPTAQNIRKNMKAFPLPLVSQLFTNVSWRTIQLVLMQVNNKIFFPAVSQ